MPNDIHNREITKDEDDPVDEMIRKTGCLDKHYAIQFCMADHKDWRKCQVEVKDFQDCINLYNSSKKQE